MSCAPCEARQAKLLELAQGRGQLLGIGLLVVLGLVWAPSLVKQLKETP